MSRRNRVEEVQLDTILGEVVSETDQYVPPQPLPTGEVQEYTAVDPYTKKLARVRTDGTFVGYLTQEEIDEEARSLASHRSVQFQPASTESSKRTSNTSESKEGFYFVDVVHRIGVRVSHPALEGIGAEILGAESRKHIGLFGASEEQAATGTQPTTADNHSPEQAQYGPPDGQQPAPIETSQQPQPEPSFQPESRSEGIPPGHRIKKGKLAMKFLGGCTVAYVTGSAVFGVLSWVPLYGPQHTLWSEKGQVFDDLEAVLNFATQHAVTQEK